MIPSWRSCPIRSRSSTTASCLTCSCSRAFSIAMPAWWANSSTSCWSPAENSPAPRLSVRYRLPMARPLTRIGTPSSDVIGGWFGGKPYESGWAAMSGIRYERPSRMISPSSPWPVGGGPMQRALLGRDADRDEALDPAELVDDPEGRVAGIDEGAHALDDELEHGVEVEHARRSRASRRRAPRGRRPGRPRRCSSSILGTPRSKPSSARPGDNEGQRARASGPEVTSGSRPRSGGSLNAYPPAVPCSRHARPRRPRRPRSAESLLAPRASSARRR